MNAPVAVQPENQNWHIVFQFSGVPFPTDRDWHWWGKLDDAGRGAVVVLRGSAGIVNEFEYETVSKKIEPGEGFVLYSDGVSEAINSQGTMYSSERIGERLAGLSGRHPAEIGRLLMDDLHRHVGDEEQSDDISIVVFGRNNLSET